MAYLQCPDCRLTAPATAYYLRGDQCPRCLTVMQPYDRARTSATASAPPPRVLLEEPAETATMEA